MVAWCGRFATAILAVMPGLVAAGAALAAGDWLADERTGCKVWNGLSEPGETATWDGPCPEGTASGEGTLLWFLNGKPNGSYVGQRVNGKAEGYGINTWLNGDRYEGYWKNDLPNGKGTYTWANGSGYQGEWVDGAKHGRAVYIWPSGDRFEGTYKNNNPFGGIYVKADGTRYIAEIYENSIGPGARFFTPEERALVRTIGTRICRPGNAFFGLIDTTIVGFVEDVHEERIKIRIARTAHILQSYQDIQLTQDTIIWDNAENWQACASSS